MSVNNDFPAGLKPLREPTFFILLALSNQRKHGYAILKDVQTLSGGRVRLSTGTLYGALSRLLDRGVIQKSVEEDVEFADLSDAGSGEPRVRKYYELTPFGQRVFKREISRLQDLLSTARQELSGEGV